MVDNPSMGWFILKLFYIPTCDVTRDNPVRLIGLSLGLHSARIIDEMPREGPVWTYGSFDARDAIGYV